MRNRVRWIVQQIGLLIFINFLDTPGMPMMFVSSFSSAEIQLTRSLFSLFIL
jgi:hypothetical protein